MNLKIYQKNSLTQSCRRVSRFAFSYFLVLSHFYVILSEMQKVKNKTPIIFIPKVNQNSYFPKNLYGTLTDTKTLSITFAKFTTDIKPANISRQGIMLSGVYLDHFLTYNRGDKIKSADDVSI